MVKTLLLSAVLLAGLQSSLAAQTLPGSGAFYVQACHSLAANDASTSNDLILPSFYCALEIDDLQGVGRILPADSRFCKPADVTLPQMAGVAAAYLDAHADRQSESFMTLAGTAFHEKWPCS
ncbi:hypothetical protein GCM10007874_25660 [Labrys miyagiensis]|uniref:Rap1a immunity protein domain-containing protein n=1 Tax=Labrys miyagiensis TaxID=346912 RepID=A0ABQ6CIH7_9HYPH|nr:Rap1a/Tai family immunity protein [Labrys miyagiensis]GLS19549.1 hypothetical protein GCM10007874_25660 [Labrys miyagiensis]